MQSVQRELCKPDLNGSWLILNLGICVSFLESFLCELPNAGEWVNSIRNWGILALISRIETLLKFLCVFEASKRI